MNIKGESGQCNHALEEQRRERCKKTEWEKKEIFINAQRSRMHPSQQINVNTRIRGISHRCAVCASLCFYFSSPFSSRNTHLNCWIYVPLLRLFHFNIHRIGMRTPMQHSNTHLFTSTTTYFLFAFLYWSCSSHTFQMTKKKIEDFKR